MTTRCPTFGFVAADGKSVEDWYGSAINRRQTVRSDRSYKCYTRRERRPTERSSFYQSVFSFVASICPVGGVAKEQFLTAERFLFIRFIYLFICHTL